MTRRLLVALVGAVALALAGAPSAFAQTPSPWWGLYSEVAPTHLPPGGNGTIVLVLGNLGASAIDGSGAHPVLLTDRLPPGLTPRSFTSPTRELGRTEGRRGKVLDRMHRLSTAPTQGSSTPTSSWRWKSRWKSRRTPRAQNRAS